MIGLATQRVIVTEQIFTKSVEEVSMLEDFLDLALLGMGANPVEKGIGLSGGVTGCLDRRGRVGRVNNHGVLN